MNSFLAWIGYAGLEIYTASIVVPAFIILFGRLDANDRLVAFIIFLYSTTDIVASVMSFHKIPNLRLYNLVLIPQFIAISILINRNLLSSKLKQVFGTGGVLLMIIHVVNISLYQENEVLANFTYIPACAWLAVFSFLYLHEQMEQVNRIPFDNLVSWFALATLIDNTGTIPILSMLGWSDYIHSSYASHLYEIVIYLYGLWYLIILTGLLWTRTSLRSVFSSR